MTTSTEDYEITDEFEVVIPDEVIDVLGWREGDILEWAVVGDGVRITRVPPDELGVAEGG